MTIDEKLAYWEDCLERVPKPTYDGPLGREIYKGLQEAIELIRHLRPFGFSDESIQEALDGATAIRQENCWLVERRLLGQKDGWFWGGDRSVEEAIKAIRYTKDQAEAVAALLSVMYPTAGWKAVEHIFAPAQPKVPEHCDPMRQVCTEIQRIMRTYHEQYPNVSTPGGLEHMGDVWRLLGKWDELLADGSAIQSPCDPARWLLEDRPEQKG